MELTRSRGGAIARALLVAGVALALSAAAPAEGPATFGPNVSYYQVDASELGAYSSGNQYGNFGLLRYALNTGYRLAAPVHLPSGALVTSVELDFYDGSATESVYASLATCSNAGGVCEATFAAGGCVDGGATLCSGVAAAPGFGSVLGTVGGLLIDNLAHQYAVAVGNTAVDGSVAISAVRIGYVLSVSPAPGGGASFSDVPPDHPFFQYVEALAASGITGGCGGGKYCPDAPLTRGQMAVFLAKALGLSWAGY